MEPKWLIKGGNEIFRAVSSRFHCDLHFSSQSCLQVRQGVAGEILEGGEAFYWPWEVPSKIAAKETRGSLPKDLALLGISCI